MYARPETFTNGVVTILCSLSWQRTAAASQVLASDGVKGGRAGY